MKKTDLSYIAGIIDGIKGGVDAKS